MIRIHLRWGLTVQQPWAWAIGAGLKLVEMRSWAPGPKQLDVGEHFVVHGGLKSPTRDDYWRVKHAARAVGREGEVPMLGGHEFGPEYGRGRAVAVVRFAGVVRHEAELPEKAKPWWRAVAGDGRFSCGWLLEDVHQLQLSVAPRLRGALGLWALQPADASRIERILELPLEAELWRRTA